MPKPATKRRAPKVAPEPRYCLSFTAAGLRPELAAVIAGIQLKEGDWSRTKVVVLERNMAMAILMDPQELAVLAEAEVIL